MSATSIGGYHVCVSPNGTDLPDAGSGGMPIGAISLWGTATAPANWLLCDGAAISRSTYADLFAVIGTTWGAPDSVPLPFYGSYTYGDYIMWFRVTDGTIPAWFKVVGNKFTVTGGKAGYSSYSWSVAAGTSNGVVFASATDNGNPVYFTGFGEDFNAGTMTITTPTYFNVPDTGNKTIRGTKSGTLAPNAQAGSDTTSVTLFAANLPPHRHGFSSPGVLNVISAGSQQVLQGAFNAGQVLTNASQTYDNTTGASPNLVTNSPFSVATTNPYIAIPYIIKYT